MEYNTRILVVDDNESIHGDFRKVLVQETSVDHAELDEVVINVIVSPDGEEVVLCTTLLLLLSLPAASNAVIKKL